jgi:hypothetical protein
VGMLGYGWPRTMLTYTAASPLGPYTRATRNLNSLNGSCYFSRFLRGPSMEILISHQTWTYRGTHVAYISPYKLAHLDDDGTFRLRWYGGNERFKGDPLSPAADAADPQFMAAVGNVSAGVLIEASFSLPAADSAATTWPGFLIDQGAGLSIAVSLQPDGVVSAGDYRKFVDVPYVPAGRSLPTQSAADWVLSGGAGVAPTRVPGSSGTDIRSGGPGGVGSAMLAHPLDSRGHLLTGVSLSFQYVAGYTPPSGQTINGSTVSVRLVDAHNLSTVATICTTPQLNNYSFDHFTSESPPVHCNASEFAIGWPRQLAIQLIFTNNQRNIQVPLNTIVLGVVWGALQPGPYNPTPVPPSVAVRERWSRDYDLGQPGDHVAARLLYRRGMLELYLNDFIYPVYCDTPGTGRFGVTNHAAVTGLQWWRMSLPAEADWDDPRQLPSPDTPKVARAKFGLLPP